jgi:hypothetical protein
MVYLAKDELRILWIQNKAISNFNSNSKQFNLLKQNNSSNYYYHLGIDETDSIYISITNLDTRNAEGSRETDIWERYEKAKRINIDTFNVSHLLKQPNGDLKYLDQNKFLIDWELVFNGEASDINLIPVLKKLNINPEVFNAQIKTLKRINCRSLLTHKYGVELTYNDGFVFQAGCIVNMYYPIKYNIGENRNSSRLYKGLKSLQNNTQCYIYY